MPTIRKFEDIKSWQLARSLCISIGEMIDTGKFKSHYRLISQIEGSSGSIMDNIAEGFERGTRLEFITFLGYAKASCAEFRSQLYRALDRKLLSTSQFQELYSTSNRIGALIYKLIRYLQSTSVKGLRKA